MSFCFRCTASELVCYKEFTTPFQILLGQATFELHHAVSMLGLLTDTFQGYCVAQS